jgi:hypothetical protein
MRGSTITSPRERKQATLAADQACPTTAGRLVDTPETGDTEVAIVLINGEFCRATALLCEGDSIEVFPRHARRGLDEKQSHYGAAQPAGSMVMWHRRRRCRRDLEGAQRRRRSDALAQCPDRAPRQMAAISRS